MCRQRPRRGAVPGPDHHGRIAQAGQAGEEIGHDRHGRAVINFQLTITLLLLIGLSGFFVFPLLGEGAGIFFSVMALYFGTLLLNVVFIVLNIFLVLRSGRMWYPLAIPFLRKKKSLAAGA